MIENACESCLSADRLTLRLISILLQYPGETVVWRAIVNDFDALQELPDHPASDLLASAIEQMRCAPQGELAQLYVSEFDFNESASLYLTAHEYGDSRKRSFAMLALKRLYAEAGYGEEGGELPDYLPKLFEFLSIEPQGLDTFTLQERLAVVCHVIAGHLTENSSYQKIFRAALYLLPDVDLVNGIPFPNRGTADSNVPYPVVY